MPRIKFLEDFDYKPIPQQTYSYRKGDVVLVTQEIANKAIAANKAEATEFPSPPAGINETLGKYRTTKRRRVKPDEHSYVPAET